MSDQLRRIFFDRSPGRWIVGLVLAVVLALLFWFGLGQDGGSRLAGSAAPGAGLLPPVEEAAVHAAGPGLSDAAPRDVIPPAEP